MRNRALEAERAGAAGADLAEAGALTDCAHAVAGLAVAGTDAGRIDQIRALEDLKAACAAAQARVTAAFAASQRAAAETLHGASDESAGGAGAPHAGATATGRRREAAQLRQKAARLAQRSSAAQVALARRESPAIGGRFVGLAEALVHEMPLTLAALAGGVINESRATIIVRETACLSAENRGAVDGEIAERLDGLGDGRLQALVRRIAYRLEPVAATRRAIRAARDRRVSVRPAPDAMAYLTLLLPLASAVACYGQLRRAADGSSAVDAHGEGTAGGSLGAVGGDTADARTSAQRMADIAVARIMGAQPAAAGQDPAPTPEPDRRDPTGRSHHVDSRERCDRTDPVAALRAAYATRLRMTGLGALEPANDQTTAQANSPDTGLHDTGLHDTGPDDARPHGTRPPGAPAFPPGNPPSEGPPGAGSSGAAPPGAALPNPALQGTAPPALPPRAPDPATSEPVGAQAFPPGAGVVVNIVISDSALCGASDEPAHLTGNLPIPAPLARRMIAGLPRDARVWIRRLYTRPDVEQLVAMDSRRRVFPPGMRELLFTRDLDTCRTPWCNAPARHADHVRPHAAGGPTSMANGQSLSEDCNYIRTAPGWSATRAPTGDIVISTPTGHRYRSPAPELGPRGPVLREPARQVPSAPQSHAERLLERLLAA